MIPHVEGEESYLFWGHYHYTFDNLVTLTFDLMTPKQIRFFPFHRGIMWPSLLKFQYTELKLSWGNDPVVKNYIYSNGDLDL
jgi:hypothetical protein